MAHYWTADDHAAVRQAQVEDWLEDLVEFGPEVVVVACREWRRHNDRRPTPHNIRLLAIAEQRRRNPEPEPVYLPEPERKAPAAADREYVDNLMRGYRARSRAAFGLPLEESDA